MRRALAALLALTMPALCWAGSNISPNPAYTRNLSLGTKGFANYSVSLRSAIQFKGATATGTATAVKVFFDGDESKVYPTSGDTLSVRRGVSKVGFRAYSTATPVNVYVLGE